MLNTIYLKKSITELEITLFLRQFATLLSEGIPIIQSCDILEKNQRKTAMHTLIRTIKKEILAGKSLSQSLQTHPKYFNQLLCQLLHIGEHTGKLENMMKYVADDKEKNLLFKKRIKQSLFYPLLITSTALLMTASMFVFIIPRFAALFQDKVSELPLLTRSLFWLSKQFTTISSGFIALIFLLLLFLRSTHSQNFKKSFLAQLKRFPIIYPCLHKMRLASFARHLATTFSAGLSISAALPLIAPTYEGEFSATILALRRKVQSGLSLHQAMTLFTYFPAIMIQMIKIGEEAGALDTMLGKLADFFESDVTQSIGQLTQLLEPLIMLVLGVLIGGIVIGMYLPIFKLGSIL